MWRYIKQGVNYKLRKDLQIYKPKELESTFVEVLEPGMSKNNMIIGCIYHHPSMELSEFNNNFLSVLSEKYWKKKNCSTTRRLKCWPSKIWSWWRSRRFLRCNVSLSDHLAQILIVPVWNTTRHKEPKKVHHDPQEILRNKDIISRDLQNTNWDAELQSNSENINTYQPKKLLQKSTT